MSKLVVAMVVAIGMAGCAGNALTDTVTVPMETNIHGAKLFKTIPDGSASVWVDRAPLADAYELEARDASGAVLASYSLSGGETMKPWTIPDGATVIAVGDVGPGPWEYGRLIFQLH